MGHTLTSWALGENFRKLLFSCENEFGKLHCTSCNIKHNVLKRNMHHNSCFYLLAFSRYLLKLLACCLLPVSKIYVAHFYISQKCVTYDRHYDLNIVGTSVFCSCEERKTIIDKVKPLLSFQIKAAHSLSEILQKPFYKYTYFLTFPHFGSKKKLCDAKFA